MCVVGIRLCGKHSGSFVDEPDIGHEGDCSLPTACQTGFMGEQEPGWAEVPILSDGGF